MGCVGLVQEVYVVVYLELEADIRCYFDELL